MAKRYTQPQRRAIHRRAKRLIAAWDESKHPRDEDGKFTEAGGGDASPAAIEGLPANVTVKDRLISQARERKAFDLTAVETKKDSKGRTVYELIVAAKIPSGIESVVERPDRSDRVAYYDPALADLHTFHKGEQYLELTLAKPKAGLSEEIEPLPGDDIIYRGMRAEEYEKFLQTGEIVSTGKYNIGPDQKGLTYWATDPATAASYANSFAPWPHKATFEKPAYVVATKLPKETRKVSGTGENEVGVARAVTKDEIIGVWRGDVYSHRPGHMNLRPVGYAMDETEYEIGASSSPSSSVVWRKT